MNLNEILREKLNNLNPKIKKIKSKFKELKIIPNNLFPSSSMTFIQNPNYKKTYLIYKKVMKSSDLDYDLFDILFEETEKIGIVDVPKIYERWCLLQIIKVLIHKFNYKIEANWKRKLIGQILKHGKNIKLELKNEEINKIITLGYEKELESGKRPDFTLDVSNSDMENEPNIKSRLIMDAKFKEMKSSNNEVSQLINDLYNNKDYSEDNKNSVFILHPSKNSIIKRTTPQSWGENCYYGEDNKFDWDEKLPNHKYGSILLTPLFDEDSSIDHLQRVIGMFLQYSIESNDVKKNSVLPKGKIFCLVCGSSNVTINKYETKNKNDKYYCKCNECHHFFVINFCSNCKNRLWKHGTYWTYHKTDPINPYFIECPLCGE